MNDTASQPAPPTEWPSLPEAGMIERILDIVAKEAEIDRKLLVPDAKMDSLDIPSFDMVMILMEVEEAFNVYIPMGGELAEAVYLHDLVEILASKMIRKDGVGKAPSGPAQA